jgi:hypothetical protein
MGDPIPSLDWNSLLLTYDVAYVSIGLVKPPMMFKSGVH